MAMDRMLLGLPINAAKATLISTGLNWFAKKGIILSWVCFILLAFWYFLVSNFITLESVQTIAYALILSNVSFSPETFIEIAAALPLVSVCFLCNFAFILVLFCVGFDDDLTTELFVMKSAALDWVLSFSSDWSYESVALGAFLVGMMELPHYVRWWTCNNGNTNRRNLQLLPAWCFYLFGLTIFSPDKPTTNLFVDSDFGCVSAMTKLIMRMICIVCKNDSLLTTHPTPLVIGVPSAKSFCGKTSW